VLADLDGMEPGRTQTALDRAETQILFPLVAAEPRRLLPSPTRRLVVATLALAIVAAGIAGFVAFGSTSSKPLHVPRVLGLEAARAEARLRNAHFAPVIKHASSDQFSQGLVYRAVPGPGSALKSGRPVTIWISTGPATSVVPNLVGTSLSRAERVLSAAHLELITKRIPSGRYGVDRITRQAPGRGGRLPAGGTMTLWVSTGSPRVLVPDVRGETAQQATRDLRNAGFEVKNAGPSTATSDYSLVGKVAGQSPVAVKARKKSVVIISVYYYVAPPPPPPPPPVTYPPTIGVT
jgi:serine/threonine-protein kinase